MNFRLGGSESSGSPSSAAAAPIGGSVFGSDPPPDKMVGFKEIPANLGAKV